MKTIFIFLLLFQVHSFSVARADESNATYVEVEPEPDSTISYKERRQKNGFIFAIGNQQYFPSDYYSLHDDLNISNFLGTSPFEMMNIELGYKRNFALGALGVTIDFSKGSNSSEYTFNSGTSTSTIKRGVTFQTIELMAYYFADNFFSEPWVVPYVGVGLNHTSFVESKEGAADLSRTAELGASLKLGIEFQLNGLDKRSSEDAFLQLGLENTFLDIYAYQNLGGQDFATTQEEINNGGAPDIASRAALGVGLRLEF